jgi:L-iditol 2-dehydrogenase
MRQYKLVGRKAISLLTDIPIPTPGDGEVLVRVGACTVCNRSDLVYYHYLGLRDHCAVGCFGHEIAGIVEAVGPTVTRARVGDRVFIRTPLTSGYAEYALAREIAVGRVPADVPFEQAAILQLLPLAVHATRGVELGDRVLVIGQGPVGLMALQVLRLRGAASITAVDLDPWRLSRSAALGATETIAVNAGELRERVVEVMRDGFDVAIDAVGTPATVQTSVAAVRQNGLVILLGTHHIDVEVRFDLVTWEKKGLRIHSSAEPTDAARIEAMRIAQRLVDADSIRLAEILTHRYRLEDLPLAIEQLSQSSVLDPEGAASRFGGTPPQTLKIAICP